MYLSLLNDSSYGFIEALFPDTDNYHLCRRADYVPYKCWAALVCEDILQTDVCVVQSSSIPTGSER